MRAALSVGLSLIVSLGLVVAGLATSASVVARSTPPSALPLLVIENVGQLAAGVRFAVAGADGGLLLTDDSLWLVGGDRAPAAEPTVPRLRLASDAAMAGPEPFGRQATRVASFIGDDPALWRTDIPVWTGVRYRQVWPGVDLEIDGGDGQLRWRWVTSGAHRPPAVPFAITGAVSEATDGQHLTLTTATDRRMLALPALATDLTAAAATPLTFSTLYGSTGTDNLNGLAVDAAGNSYLVGTTFSLNLAVTPGARDPSWNGLHDMFVAKLNASGTGLVYATYLGGLGDDAANAVAVDAAGNAHVVGVTASSNFPRTPGSAQSSFRGGTDAVAVKLNATGSTLLYGTFLGGGGADSAQAIALDGAGNAVIAGTSGSSDFPVTPGAAQTTRGGGTDAFVAKLNAAGTAFFFTTLLGGAGSDAATAVALDGQGNPVIAGTTASASGLATTGAAQPTYGGGGDAFAAKLNGAGTAWLYATYLGGGKDDQAHGVAVDGLGAAYVVGGTVSTNFPTTYGVLLSSIDGARKDYSGFAAKLSPNGSRLVYGTYLGGTGDDVAVAVAVEPSGAITIGGRTASTDFPVTADATQATTGGAYDGFASKLTTTGASLAFSTYLGGEADDYVRALARGGGALYLGGLTGSIAFPTTTGAYQRVNRGGSDAFVAKLPLAVDAAGPLPTAIDDGTSVVGAATAATTWYFAEGYTGPGFDEYLLVFNPSPATANVTVTYYLANGTQQTRTTSIAPNRRATFTVHDPVTGVGRNQEVGARVESSQPVVAERPMFFDSPSYAGSHSALGATALSTVWYFAEGYTGTGFDEYLTLLNPNASPADVTITYYLATEEPRTTTLTVGATSRRTVVVHEPTEGVGRDQAVAIKVVSSQPIAAERPMYFHYANGGSGGHTILGATAPTTSWLFGEGYTGGTFDEYLTILNANSGAATVTLTYYLTGAAAQVKTVSVPGDSRATVAVHETTFGVGRDQAVSVQVTSDLAIVVERPIYFVYTIVPPAPRLALRVSGGHDVMGASALSTTWYFAGGGIANASNTTNDYDEYLTIMNPGASEGTATIRYHLDDGSSQVKTVTLPAASRTTVAVHDANAAGGLGRLTVDHAIVVETTVPTVVERPLYLVYRTTFTA